MLIASPTVSISFQEDRRHLAHHFPSHVCPVQPNLLVHLPLPRRIWGGVVKRSIIMRALSAQRYWSCLHPPTEKRAVSWKDLFSTLHWQSHKPDEAQKERRKEEDKSIYMFSTFYILLSNCVSYFYVPIFRLFFLFFFFKKNRTVPGYTSHSSMYAWMKKKIHGLQIRTIFSSLLISDRHLYKLCPVYSIRLYSDSSEPPESANTALLSRGKKLYFKKQSKSSFPWNLSFKQVIPSKDIIAMRYTMGVEFLMKPFFV